MSAADANAGVLYVVNPNNPTGTMPPTADIEWLVDNKPAGSIVVIDEAYIHFSKDYPNNTLTINYQKNPCKLIGLYLLTLNRETLWFQRPGAIIFYCFYFVNFALPSLFPFEYKDIM